MNIQQNSQDRDQNLIRSILFPGVRFLISLLMALLLMWILLQLWKALQIEEPSGYYMDFKTEVSSFVSHAIRSIFIIIPALLVSSICAGAYLFTSVLLPARFPGLKIVGSGLKIAFFALSSLPCILASYIIVKLLPISLTYDARAPISLRWTYYILPAVILGISDGFLTELILSSEDELNSIRREGYVRMSKLIGANIWYRIKNDFFIHTSRAFLSRTAALLSGTVVVEFVFRLPGLGSLAFDAAEDSNVPRLMYILIFSVIIVGFFNLLHRLIAVIYDPRLR